MKNKEKKAVLLAAVAGLAALTACMGGKNGSQKNGGPDKKAFRVGICQFDKNDSLDAATEGFKDALTKKLGGSVKFYEQNAGAEASNCSEICEKFAKDGVDLIFANGEESLRAAAAASEDIPILGTSAAGYADALNLSEWTGRSNKNVSGTYCLAPIERQKDFMLDAFPDAEQIGIVYFLSDPDSSYQADLMKTSLDGDGVSHKDYPVENEDGVENAVASACEECGAIYVPADARMASAVEIIENIVVPAGIPLFSGGEQLFSAAAATLVPKYYDLGLQTGEMAIDILVDGKDSGEINVQYAAKYDKTYNEEICGALNIEVPDDYE